MDGQPRYAILYVDDDEQNLFLFRSVLPETYDVLTASSGPQALELLAARPVHVLLADQRMPRMSGVQLLERAGRDHPETIRILVTGYAEIEVVIDAINRGSVYRYISKPWNADELLAIIRNALEVWELRRSNLALMASLDAQNRRLQEKVAELSLFNELILALRDAASGEEAVLRTIERLRAELKAAAGFWGEPEAPAGLRLGRPEGEEGAAAAESIRRAAGWGMLRAVTLPPPEPLLLDGEGGRTVYLLPLRTPQESFGFLAFLLAGRPEAGELSFCQAAAHLTASFLHSLRVRQEERARERFLLLGQMAGMIVHDLKGPLSTIRGFAELLCREDLEVCRRAEYGQVLQKEAERLRQMIEELLSFSRGERRLHPGPVEAGPFLREILGLYEPCFQRSRIEVELDLEPPQRFVADEGKLKKVLINLLDNARDVLVDHPGPRRIRIRTRWEGGDLRLQVANSGPPIPAEHLSRLFDPFFSSGKEDGTGLGLTICRSIAEEHGGCIRASSSAAETVFTLQLPSSIPSATSES